MDTVEYTKTLRRLCESQANCPECPLHENCEEDNYVYCNGNANEYAEKAVQIVEQWGKEHTVKTRQSEFLKRFPNAKTMNDVITICPNDIDSTYRNMEYCDHSFCEECCKKYWNEEVTDND